MTSARRRMGRTLLRLFGVAVLAATTGLLVLAWWARPTLMAGAREAAASTISAARRLAESTGHFHVQRIRVRGARLTPPADVVRALDLDSGATIWSPTRIARLRIEELPAVREARIDRRLPGEIVISVREAPPVGWWAGAAVPTLITEAGRLVTRIEHRDSLGQLPSVSAAGPQLDTLALKSARLLLRGAVPWSGEIRAFHFHDDGSYEVSLADGSRLHLPRNPLPGALALVPALRDLRVAAGDSVPGLVLDLRFRRLVIARRNPLPDTTGH